MKKVWDAEIDVIVAGAGGCGLVSALAIAEKGFEVAVFEKTDRILGNTAASAGMIPAAGTRFQREAGIYETADEMTEDIQIKNNYESDQDIILALCKESGPLVEWLADKLGIEMSLVNEFKYPGQRNKRMHAPLSRSGLELIKKLRAIAMENNLIHLLMRSEVNELVMNDNRVVGVKVLTLDGEQFIKGKKVILATNGFGANQDLVQEHIPEIANAIYFGCESNTGDALKMGEKVGAASESLGAYQGHSAVEESRGLLVTWGTIMMGGFMVNKEGRRFGNEAKGYSEFSVELIRQTDQCGYIIFDQEIFRELLTIEDFRNLNQNNAFIKSSTLEGLAEKINVNINEFKNTTVTFQANKDGQKDEYGRSNFPKKLKAPFIAVRVVPALFHTQGGLKINKHAQVLKKDGLPIPNLYAGGGAAVGVSGKSSYGYMSGNGLLSALGFGKIAAEHAAKTLQKDPV